MPYTITTSEVKDGFTTGASDADLTAYIAVADQADACLTANSVADAIGKQLKILAVRHMAANATDGGNVTQERAVSGASRSYAERRKGSTGYLDTLRSLDTYGCVMALLVNNQYVQFRSVGKYRET